jgi:hypothetical protein
MAYTAPTFTASGTTFAQLQAGGVSGQLERLITANAGEPLSFFRSAKQGNLQEVYRHVSKTVTEFLRGQPVVVSALETDLKNAHATFLALATLCNEIGVLIDANQGTLGQKTTGIGILEQHRTWP